ncbi:MAG: SDR family oxidoreductase [Paracoccus sp. (in: a-proteobacteria)]|nr:SDR family oxidoreductase [Paracoccus sp. (in: a-proteobacteria)]
MQLSAVIGAGGGIGRQIAAALLARGDTVFLLDLPARRAEIGEMFQGPAARFIPCDLTSEASISAAFGQIEGAGDLTACVNAAGIIRRGSFMEMEAHDVEAVMAVNVVGCHLAMQEAARLIARAGGGKIVNLASVHGLRTSHGRSAYAVSKGAVMALTRAMAVELAQYGILVNAVAPGPVTAGLQEGEAAPSRTAWNRATPLGRVARAEDVTAAVMFLLSEANEFVTGETLTVDGGASAGIALG